MTGAGGFNPHKRPPQQAPSQQAIPNANEAQDASVQGQQIPGMGWIDARQYLDGILM